MSSKGYHYLVGYDGGKLSNQAAHLAADKLESRGGVVLTLVYVIDWSEFEIMTVEELSIRHTQQVEQMKSAEKNIMEPAKLELKRDHVEVETMVQVGHAADIISNVADEHKADQIFIGHKSKGFLVSLGLGSVAYGVLQKAKVPVTVVP